MPVLTKSQRDAFQRILARVNYWLQKIELLERLGQLNAALAERAAELRAKRDYMQALAEAALTFDDSTLELERDGPKRNER